MRTKALLFSACVLALCAGPLRAANTIFVTVENLDCKNPDSRHSQAFNAITFSFGASNPTGIGSGGSGSSQPTGGDIMVTKGFDVCTPQLLKDLARGTHVNEVAFEWQTTGSTGAPLVFMKITLHEVVVSGVNYSAGQEAVSFSWAVMTLDFWPILPNGSLGGKITVTWDKQRGTAS